MAFSAARATANIDTLLRFVIEILFDFFIMAFINGLRTIAHSFTRILTEKTTGASVVAENAQYLLRKANAKGKQWDIAVEQGGHPVSHDTEGRSGCASEKQEYPFYIQVRQEAKQEQLVGNIVCMFHSAIINKPGAFSENRSSQNGKIWSFYDERSCQDDFHGGQPSSNYGYIPENFIGQLLAECVFMSLSITTTT
ncbi:uncharacterized protein EURHEDRAFT_399305 [Aspergillus ruber CBS 135680]|uniref:Uncharacterized protein n=1 Tax=Aspergillus ruber (strain CBS 135680) TaxID=1388766 RepID=A0A017SPY1_ASPRC|nr:uncharacterized protein EURHEDRAFT_399305 [Aspergillus ruber CBS 135680]EYE99002.1 hypothetical protein EURHEDRAFT_399305 [Aspergillus ruber CBS 135680]